MHNIYYLGLSGEHRCPLGYLFTFIVTCEFWSQFPVSFNRSDLHQVSETVSCQSKYWLMFSYLSDQLYATAVCKVDNDR